MSTVSIAMVAFALVASGGGDRLRYAESCRGSETIQVGDQPTKTAPYALAFSADLKRRLYCYGACTRQQSYRIADATSDPIALSAVGLAGQSRRLAFSVGRARLTDDQVILTGPIRVERHAVASCTPARYRLPPAG